MDLNKIINIFNANTTGTLAKSDLADPSKKNNAAVKTLKNIFDKDISGTLDSDELALLDKFAALDEQEDISIDDLKLFSALNGSASQVTFGDLSFLKTNRYSSTNNAVSTFGTNNSKTSDTVINSDGSVTKTVYAGDKSQVVSEYTKDFKIKTKTTTKASGLVNKENYNDAGNLVEKYETFIDGSSTTTFYNDDFKVIQVIKKDSEENLVSSEEYDYDESGKKASVVAYNTEGKEISRTSYNSDNSRIQVNYDADGNIIKREIYNRQSKVIESFVKNDDGTTQSYTCDYANSGDTTATTKTFDNLGNQISEQISITDRKGNKQVTLDGVIIQKDTVGADRTSTSTIYALDGTITSVTLKDRKGQVTKVDYYTYLDGKTDTITEKNGSGAVIGTGKYNYDNPAVIKTLDHFDGNGVLLDTSIWNRNPVGTKTVNKFNVTQGDLTGNLTENYGTDDKLTSTLFVAENGISMKSDYTYDKPEIGDTSVVSTSKDSNNNITRILNYVEHSDGSSESNYYNADKTLLLAKDVVDKSGNTVSTIYSGDQIDTISKIDKYGTLRSTDDYIYTDGILSSVAHYNANDKLTGTTNYDALGNTQEYDSLGKITAFKTTDPDTGLVIEGTYRYISTGDKYATIKTSLNSEVQSVQKIIVYNDKSSEISTYTADYIIKQKDSISADGKIKSTIYDSESDKVLRVVNKDANGNILSRNEYTYKQTAGKIIDTIDTYDKNNLLMQKTQYVGNNRVVTTYNPNGSIKSSITYDEDDNVIS